MFEVDQVFPFLFFSFSTENTITGSIGVASLRPTFTKKFFDRFFVNVQSFFTGSQASSSLHDLDDQQIERQKENIDEMYSEFLKKVSRSFHLRMSQLFISRSHLLWSPSLLLPSF